MKRKPSGLDMTTTPIKKLRVEYESSTAIDEHQPHKRKASSLDTDDITAASKKRKILPSANILDQTNYGNLGSSDGRSSASKDEFPPDNSSDEEPTPSTDSTDLDSEDDDCRKHVIARAAKFGLSLTVRSLSLSLFFNHRVYYCRKHR